MNYHQDLDSNDCGNTREQEFKIQLTKILNTKGLPHGFYEGVKNLQQKKFNSSSPSELLALTGKLLNSKEQRLLP